MNEELISILEKVVSKITDGSDPGWGYSYDAKELRIEIENYINQIKAGDLSSLDTLKYLFLPTCKLQEHSMANYWADEYIEISTEFDKIYERLKLSGNGQSLTKGR